MGNKIILTIIFVIVGIFTNAQRIEVGNRFLSDSDNTLNTKYNVGYYHKFNKLWLSGVEVAKYNYKDDIGKINFNSLSFNNYINKDSSYKLEINTECQFTKEINFFKYDIVGGIYTKKQIIYVELFSNRDWVETVNCIRNNISFISYGLSADFNIIRNRLTFVSAYSNLYFSDNNSKSVKVFKMIGYPHKNMGIIVSSKLIDSDIISENYFSPLNFDTYSLSSFVIIPMFNETFVIKPLIGGGKQNIDNVYNNYWLIEFSLKGWYKDKYGIQTKISASNAINEYGQYNLIMGSIKLIYQIK